MNHINKFILSIICIVGVLTTAMPVKATDTFELAWNEMVVPLKPNTYQTISYYTIIRNEDGEIEDEMENVYQIDVPYNALLTIQYNGTKKNNSLLLLRNRGYTDSQYIKSGKEKTAKKCFVVEKGRYYVVNQDKKKSVSLKYSIKKIKAKDRGNYLRKKAVKLKKNKKESVLQMFSKNYYRWYKITVPKEQKIQLIGKATSLLGEKSNQSVSVGTFKEYGYTLMQYPFCDLFIFDAKGDVVSCKNTKKGIITEQKVPKGTYYVKVNCGDVKKGWGEYVEFRWK